MYNDSFFKFIYQDKVSIHTLFVRYLVSIQSLNISLCLFLSFSFSLPLPPSLSLSLSFFLSLSLSLCITRSTAAQTSAWRSRRSRRWRWERSFPYSDGTCWCPGEQPRQRPRRRLHRARCCTAPDSAARRAQALAAVVGTRANCRALLPESDRQASERSTRQQRALLD